jgi:hypothetical protein
MSDTFAPPTPGRAYESSIHAAAHDAAVAAAAGLHAAPAAAPASEPTPTPTPTHSEPSPASAAAPAPAPAPVAPPPQQQQQQQPPQPPLDEARLPKGVALAPGGKVRLTDYVSLLVVVAVGIVASVARAPAVELLGFGARAKAPGLRPKRTQRMLAGGQKLAMAGHA